MSEIEAVAVDEEIVDASPATLLEPRELDGIGRIGNVEDQQPEVGVEVGVGVGVHLLYPDDRQITRGFDVYRGSGGADLGHLAHVGGIGDVDEVDDAAKIPHQRVVPCDIEVGPPGQFPFPGRGDEDDLADAFHSEAVGVLVGGEGGEVHVAGGLRVSAGGRGYEEDHQWQRGSACGRSTCLGIHGRSSWSQGWQHPDLPAK